MTVQPSKSTKSMFFKSFIKQKISFFASILLLIGAVLFWRGSWNLLEKYFLPENPLLSNILCILIAGIILLVVLLIDKYHPILTDLYSLY